MTRVEIDGVAATVAEVYRAASWNYGHYTSMQVRDGCVAGLSLHLRRLDGASEVLFPDAVPLDPGHVRGLIGHTLGDLADASVRVTVLPEPGDRTRTSVMVAVSGAATDGARAPLRVRTVTYERELPHLKHVATLGLTFQAGEARRAGFDDVLFVRRGGEITEGSVWNVAFWDGAHVVWPDGPQLAGITMQLLRQGLDRLGVPQVTRRLTRGDLSAMSAAAATNSHHPAQPIAAIDDRVFPTDGTGETGGHALIGLLNRAWQDAGWEPVRG